MLRSGGAAPETGAAGQVSVRFARIEPTGLRVLRLAVTGERHRTADAVVRWLAARTAIDRRGSLRWCAFDDAGAARLREVADGSEAQIEVVQEALDGGEVTASHVVEASAAVHPTDPSANRLHLAWEAVAPGGVLIAEVPHRDPDEPASTFARIAAVLTEAGIDVADALACVPDDADRIVLEVTRL